MTAVPTAKNTSRAHQRISRTTLDRALLSVPVTETCSTSGSVDIRITKPWSEITPKKRPFQFNKRTGASLKKFGLWPRLDSAPGPELLCKPNNHAHLGVPAGRPGHSADVPAASQSP